MSHWIDDPQLFLYAKGTGPDDVFLRRCKKPLSSSSSSSLVVPMKSDDFEYVSNVKNYVELIKDDFDWDETDYKRLVKYIYERLLLVNRQGLVIAEIYKLNDPNEVPIYIRSLDVLPLKPYIPNIRERLIPLRTVKCLEDVNGKAAAMMEEDDSNEITKLTARVDDLESKLTAGHDTIDDLKSENKTLEGKVTKLFDILTTLRQEVKNINPNYNTEEVWMNGLTNSDWVGVEELNVKGTVYGPYDNLVILGEPGTFTNDDSTTNVRARYWYRINLHDNDPPKRMAIFLEDMTPNKEKARFSKRVWWSFKSKGKTYVFRG